MLNIGKTSVMNARQAMHVIIKGTQIIRIKLGKIVVTAGAGDYLDQVISRIQEITQLLR